MDAVGLDVVLSIEEHYAEERPGLPDAPRTLTAATGPTLPVPAPLSLAFLVALTAPVAPVVPVVPVVPPPPPQPASAKTHSQAAASKLIERPSIDQLTSHSVSK
jgi:hypothetical protein